LQEPTKNRTGNGKNGGKENLDSGDEVGYISVVFIDNNNLKIKKLLISTNKNKRLSCLIEELRSCMMSVYCRNYFTAAMELNLTLSCFWSQLSQ
jgi:hypothetical protein